MRRQSRRSKRLDQIAEPERSELLVELGNVRRQMCSLMGRLTIGAPEYTALAKLTSGIDDFAEALTGDRERFWTQPSSV